MADYPDRLQPPSFRGVPFSVDRIETSGGRVLVRHRGAYRTGAPLEDVGLREHDIRVIGRISGENVFSHWQSLQGAFEQGGPGVFVHPMRGDVRVEVDDLSWTEAWDRGGMVEFTVLFVEGFEEATVPILGASAILAAADAARDAVGSEFERAFDAVGQALHVIDDAVDQVTRHTDRLRDTLLAPANAVAETAVGVAQAIDHISASVVTLLGTPGELAAAFRTVFDAVLTAGDRLGLDRLHGDTTPPRAPAGDTESEFRRTANADAIERLVAREALIASAVLLSDVSWLAFGDAEAERDRWAERMTSERDAAGASVEAYERLERLRLLVHADITRRAADLPQWTTVEPEGVTSALELAWWLYGDAERAEEIAARVSHPGFIAGPVEVLSA